MLPPGMVAVCVLLMIPAQDVEMPQVHTDEMIVLVPQEVIRHVNIQEVIKYVDLPVPEIQVVVRQVPRIVTVEKVIAVPEPLIQTDEMVEEEVYTHEVIRYVEVPVPHGLEDVGHALRVETVERVGEMPRPHIQTVELVV